MLSSSSSSLKEKLLTIDLVTHSVSVLFMGDNKVVATLSEVYSI